MVVLMMLTAVQLGNNCRLNTVYSFVRVQICKWQCLPLFLCLVTVKNFQSNFWAVRASVRAFAILHRKFVTYVVILSTFIVDNQREPESVER